MSSLAPKSGSHPRLALRYGHRAPSRPVSVRSFPVLSPSPLLPPFRPGPRPRPRPNPRFIPSHPVPSRRGGVPWPMVTALVSERRAAAPGRTCRTIPGSAGSRPDPRGQPGSLLGPGPPPEPRRSGSGDGDKDGDGDGDRDEDKQRWRRRRSWNWETRSGRVNVRNTASS